MIQAFRLRQVALGAIILAGSVHLSTAEPAQAAAPVGADTCTQWAEGYAAGYCGAQGKRVGTIGYMCNADGTATFFVLECTALLPHIPG